MATGLIAACHKRLSVWAEMVVFIHAVFMLPFMAAAIVLSTSQAGFDGFKLIWIVAAHLSARHVAMLVNRIVDRHIDALNPRTAGRALVTGLVGLGEAKLLLLVNLAVFLIACFMLNWLCVLLAPLALFIIIGYSYSKRFTVWCHMWLGIACALGPMGAWVGFTGNLSLLIWPLGLACALWVAGFDTIYAFQDMEFDRKNSLYSLPARFGRKRTLHMARLMHLAALAGFVSLYFLFALKPLYLLGCLLMALGLFYQHFISRRHNLSPLAFTSINGLISLCYLVFMLLSFTPVS